ncbi:sensor histidine kinase [uncultured Polaribacter sp.]|uniref:tetratricopeptide repeat-containing sensor histidine kinase n=1 Tax=uncultured Polaribacter sp. TaxID=174711 RepID=UPI002602149F|nr:sensor histidine kinase [uncultured Polaribacter sp.]
MNKTIQLLLLLFITPYFGQQNNYLDSILSLEDKISKTKFLESILNIKYDKALTDSKKYLILGEKAEKIALEINDSLQLAKAYKIKSLAYHFSSNLDASIKYTINAATIFNQLKDYENYANSYTNLGWQIKNINLKKGIYYMNTGIKILENNAKNSLSLASAYNNYGVLKNRINQLDSALYYHKKSLNLCLLKNDSIGIPFALTHIANVFIKKQDFKKAESNLNEALFIRKKRSDIYGIADSYLYLGDLFYSQKKYNKAINYFKKGAEISIANGYFPLRKYATEYIYKSYENTGDIKNAFSYYKTFNKIKDSVLNEKTNSKISSLEIQFNTVEKEKEIAIQKEKLLEQELSLKNKTLYAILLLASLIILSIISIGIYKKNQFKRKQLQKEIDLKDALATITTQNKLQEQRLRISRDLHDNIGSQLTFIISSIDNLKYISKDANQKLKDKLTSISSFTGDTIHELRDTIWAMNKSEISVEDLHARVLSFIEKAKVASEKTEFKIIENIDENINFSSLAGMNIFRVIQEAINNAIKYANASKIEISLQKNKDLFEVLIKDNGIGFDLNTVNLGNGLSNMEERMNNINGKVNINSKLKSGTEISISISLKNTADDV